MAAAAPGTDGSEESLEERRAKVQGLLEEMRAWPTEAQLVQQSLTTAHNTSAGEADRVVALKVLHELVEQVDVANGAPPARSLRHGCAHAPLHAAGGRPVQPGGPKLVRCAIHSL